MKSADIIFICFMIIFCIHVWQIDQLEKRVYIQSETIQELKLIVETLDERDRMIIDTLQVLD